jgi:hypothetical protein
MKNSFLSFFPLPQKAHQEYLLWVEANFGVDLPPCNDGGLPPPNPSYRDYLTEERAQHHRILVRKSTSFEG